ncbi:hypothetical protein [Acidovorax sp. BL-A-41-H1]|uniref:hypothetical protein n=1 Tax=Acidovorax sp. BL-A-41-H1 TaxID=3421102 RepID=UPI003F7A60D2
MHPDDTSPAAPGTQSQTTDPMAQADTVHGDADGSTYSAVLTRTSDGCYAVGQLLVDGHMIPVANATWPTRDEAVQAVADYARGDRNPYRV